MTAADERSTVRVRPAEILLVEDNFGDVVLTRQAFEKSKLLNNLVVAGDGEQALRMLRRQGEFKDQIRPDLVLLDLNLPKLDGRDVLSAIKNDADLKDIPVVVLSGSHAHAESARSYDLHANAYIVKPVNFVHLQEIVSSIESFWFCVVALPLKQVS
jgi:two-component system, chemotaxis family, response regulator Rcp1